MEKCNLCGRPEAYYSPLLQEVACTECVEWAVQNGITPTTNLDEQYEEYVKSFPLNDPRD